MKQKQLMEEASSYLLLKTFGEGRVEITFNSKPNSLVHFLLFSSNSRIGEVLLDPPNKVLTIGGTPTKMQAFSQLVTTVTICLVTDLINYQCAW
jgi:hypothetical protein